MAIVAYDYAAWLVLYPQFSTTVTTSAQGQEYFDLATLYCANVDGAIIPYDTTVSPPILTRQRILYLLTAHIAQLMVGCVLGGSVIAPGPIVGRVNSATQGSVSVGTDSLGLPGTAAWFAQTQWGLMAYQAMAGFRTARYRASPGRFYQPPAYPIGYGQV